MWKLHIDTIWNNAGPQTSQTLDGWISLLKRGGSPEFNRGQQSPRVHLGFLKDLSTPKHSKHPFRGERAPHAKILLIAPPPVCHAQRLQFQKAPGWAWDEVIGQICRPSNLANFMYRIYQWVELHPLVIRQFAMDNHHVSLDKPCKSYLIILIFLGNLLKLPADNLNWLNWFPNAPPCAAMRRMAAVSHFLRSASGSKQQEDWSEPMPLGQQPVQPWLPCQKFLQLWSFASYKYL